MNKLSKERAGELIIGGETLLYALFPVVIAHTTRVVPPILFAALSMFTAGVSVFIYMIFKKELRGVKNLRAVKYALIVALFVIVIPGILIFTGSSRTSGINTTILLQSEIFFTLVICGIFVNEKITFKKITGAVIMISGTLLILYSKGFSINPADLLIIAGTLFYPIGNIFAKKALTFTTPSVILFVRSLAGGAVLLFVSLIFEHQGMPMGQIISDNTFLILVNGVLIYTVSKILWYEGIKRIDIGKAILISVGGYPAVSLIFTFIFLKEIPNRFQLFGLLIICVGIFRITERKGKMKTVPPEGG